MVVAVWWTTANRTVDAYDGSCVRSDSSAPHCAREMIGGRDVAAAGVVRSSCWPRPRAPTATDMARNRGVSVRNWTAEAPRTTTGRDHTTVPSGLPGSGPSWSSRWTGSHSLQRPSRRVRSSTVASSSPPQSAPTRTVSSSSGTGREVRPGCPPPPASQVRPRSAVRASAAAGTPCSAGGVGAATSGWRARRPTSSATSTGSTGTRTAVSFDVGMALRTSSAPRVAR